MGRERFDGAITEMALRRIRRGILAIDETVTNGIRSPILVRQPGSRLLFRSLLFPFVFGRDEGIDGTQVVPSDGGGKSNTQVVNLLGGLLEGLTIVQFEGHRCRDREDLIEDGCLHLGLRTSVVRWLERFAAPK